MERPLGDIKTEKGRGRVSRSEESIHGLPMILSSSLNTNMSYQSKAGLFESHHRRGRERLCHLFLSLMRWNVAKLAAEGQRLIYKTIK